jgi:hypothetical protein
MEISLLGRTTSREVELDTHTARFVGGGRGAKAPDRKQHEERG